MTKTAARAVKVLLTAGPTPGSLTPASPGARLTTAVGGRGRNQDPRTGLTTTTNQLTKTATRTAQNHPPNQRRGNLTITPPSSTTFSEMPAFLWSSPTTRRTLLCRRPRVFGAHPLPTSPGLTRPTTMPEMSSLFSQSKSLASLVVSLGLLPSLG